jgi:hypothetical protein
MTERLPAFHLQFAAAGATFTEAEERARREALYREARRLIPGVEQLKSSRLIDRIGIDDGRLTLYFDLEHTGQTTLLFERGISENPSQALQRDLRILRDSVTERQKEIFMEVLPANAGDGARTEPTVAKRRKGGTLLALLRKHQGDSLSLQFSSGPVTLTFPAVPPFRLGDGMRRITGRIVHVAGAEVKLQGIRYVGDPDPAAATLGKKRQRFALLPAGGVGQHIGLLCAVAAVAGVRVELTVKTALDYLDDRISHYEIERLENHRELTIELAKRSEVIREFFGKNGNRSDSE